MAPGKTLGADGHQALPEAGRTAEILAKKAGVGTRTMNRAIKVREQGTPELNQAGAARETPRRHARRMDARTWSTLHPAGTGCTLTLVDGRQLAVVVAGDARVYGSTLMVELQGMTGLWPVAWITVRR